MLSGLFLILKSCPLLKRLYESFHVTPISQSFHNHMNVIRHHTIGVYAESIRFRNNLQLLDNPRRQQRIPENRPPSLATHRHEINATPQISGHRKANFLSFRNHSADSTPPTNAADHLKVFPTKPNPRRSGPNASQTIPTHNECAVRIGFVGNTFRWSAVRF